MRGGYRKAFGLLVCGGGALAAVAGPLPVELGQSTERWQQVLARAALDGDCEARLGHYVESWTRLQLPNVQALDASVPVGEYLAGLEKDVQGARMAVAECPLENLPAIAAELRERAVDELASLAIDAFLADHAPAVPKAEQ